MWKLQTCLLSIAMAMMALGASLSPTLADCECRANGKTYHHGELACLKLGGSEQLARCGMVLNNSSWKKVSDGCPLASLPADQPLPMSIWTPERASRPG